MKISPQRKTTGNCFSYGTFDCQSIQKLQFLIANGYDSHMTHRQVPVILVLHQRQQARLG